MMELYKFKQCLLANVLCFRYVYILHYCLFTSTSYHIQKSRITASRMCTQSISIFKADVSFACSLVLTKLLRLVLELLFIFRRVESHFQGCVQSISIFKDDVSFPCSLVLTRGLRFVLELHFFFSQVHSACCF